MPACETHELERIRKLGIIAGGGDLPEKLVSVCEKKGIEPFIVAFDGQTSPFLTKGREHMWTRIGAAGTILKTLKAHGIRHLVLIGGLRRPTLMELRPDLKAFEFFTRIGLKAMGDNSVLEILREVLETEGFQIHGVHEFAEDLLAKEGALGQYKPKKDDWIDIHRALEVTQTLGALDVGQAVIVQDGIVLGVEAAEGTDELIHRCHALKRKGRGGVLVKMCKPQQDRDMDLPTIGPDTVKNAAEARLSGIVTHSGQSLIVNPQKVAQMADQHKMFVIALDPLQEDV